MKVYILADWEVNQIIGVYVDKREAELDLQRFIVQDKLEILERDLIE